MKRKEKEENRTGREKKNKPNQTNKQARPTTKQIKIGKGE